MAVIEPTVELALWVGTVIAALLVAVAAITIGESVYQRIKDRRREAVRPDVRRRILEGMTRSDPEWRAWVAGLSGVEREVARTELEDYLRSTSGEEADRLRDLGRILGVPEEARDTLVGGKRHEKLQALTWLALLEEAVDPVVLADACAGDSDLRAAGARVLYEADHPDARAAGTDLLLGEGELTLSVYGLDTLQKLHRDNPVSLLERAAEDHTGWRPSLIIQVLQVLRHCGIAPSDAPRAWIVELTDHDLPAVRAAAVTALEPEGWRRDLRERVDLDRLTGDPDPETRRAVYAMLAEWGDDAAIEALADAAVPEPDQRARVRALEPIADRPDLGAPDRLEVPDDRYEHAWRWVRANAALEEEA